MTRQHTQPGDDALPGLGPISRARLAGLGVTDAAALQREDAVDLWLRLKARHAGVSLNLLYALVGAQTGMDWRTVARERRTGLLLELDARQR